MACCLPHCQLKRLDARSLGLLPLGTMVMPSVDVYENFLKRSQAVAGGRRRSQAVGTPLGTKMCSLDRKGTEKVELYLVV